MSTTSLEHRSQGEVSSAPRLVPWWLEVSKRFFRRPVAAAAFVILCLIVLAALGAPWLAPFDPAQQFRKDGFDALGLPLGPNERFLLGTDSLGRDVLSRLIWASRISLSIGFAATLLSNSIGLLIGGIAGYAGGRVDAGIMRFVDMMMSIPTFFIVLLMIVVFGPSLWILVLVIALFGWTYGARVYRAEVRSLKNQAYIEAAQGLGGSRFRIFTRHILPQLSPIIMTYVTLGIPGAIFAEAGLSFVGLGVQPPTASWGAMIFTGIEYFRQAPWIIMTPIVALLVTVLSLNLVGNGLRDALDPKRKGR
jgi:peptide/nickel transport system permease protein